MQKKPKPKSVRFMSLLELLLKARQNRPRRSQTKKWLVLSGFLHQKFAGNLKEVAQIVPDNTKTSLCLPKRQNLVLSGTIWPTCFKFPANFWSREPDKVCNLIIETLSTHFVERIPSLSGVVAQIY